MREYLRRVFELTRPYRARFALGLLCGFLAGLMAPTLGLSLKMAVDAVFPFEKGATASVSAGAGAGGAPTASRPSAVARLPAPLKAKLDQLTAWFRPPGAPSTARLVLVIGLIPAAMLLRCLLAYLNVYLLAWVGMRAANDLRARLFRHVLSLPLGIFDRTSTGDLMTRVEGAGAVSGTITVAFSTLMREPISVLTLVIALITLQPFLSLLTLLVFPACLVPLIIFGRRLRKSIHGTHDKNARMSKVMHESFTGIRVLKGYNLEPAAAEEFRQALDGVASFYMRSVRAGELPGPMIEFIGSLGVALVFAFFAFPTRFSPGQAPAGDMFAFFFMVFSLYAPLKNLSKVQHQLTLAHALVQPAYQLLATTTTVPEPAHPKPLRAHGAPIRFDHVSFSYGDKTVLQEIDLTIQPGQLVALVGRTGAGKTSLANLLPRFYDPTAGAIRIGDTDLREVASRELRANIAVVTQETILFNETIRKNIAMGRAGASDEEIVAAARHAYAHDFIMDKPGGYDAIAGEKGVNLSGGQRQRLAIARAILKDAPILVLDEATSALDTESERIVQAALEALMQGRTTLCIAHRLSTIQKADLIVVLDASRIVQTGTHAQLLQAGGLYRKLYELQFEAA